LKAPAQTSLDALFAPRVIAVIGASVPNTAYADGEGGGGGDGGGEQLPKLPNPQP